MVDGASALARRFRVSDLAIGLTIVAFGTSAPELVVNTFAASQGNEEIVFANVIGSNNFNIFIILGVAGLIAPISVQSSTVYKELPFSFLAIGLVFLLAGGWLFGPAILTSLEGALLILAFLAFLYYVYRQLGQDPAAESQQQPTGERWRMLLLIVVGLAGLVVGGRLVVDNAVALATQLGVSQKIIGLTIIAAGTSLPELVTTVVAAAKKQSNIAVGNVVGSNIFNLTLVLGASALTAPLAYQALFNIDLILLSVGTLALFLAMFTGQRHSLDRWEASLLLVFYIAYTTYLVIQEL